MQRLGLGLGVAFLLSEVATDCIVFAGVVFSVS